MNNIALIGNGYWGSKLKRYIPEFFNLKQIVNSNTDKILVWNDDSIESVIIATPIETHYDIAKEALSHNRNVFVEKPLTTNTVKANELIELADKKNLKLGVEYTQTFSPSVKKAIELIPMIGDIQYIEMSTKHLGRFMRSDVFWLLASHHLSILGMIIPLKKTGFAKHEHMWWDSNICTMGSLVFNYQRISGRIDVSTNYPGKDMQFTIYGEAGTLQYTPLDEKQSLKLVLYEKKRAELPPKLITKEEAFTYDETNNLRYSIKYFCDLLNGKEASNAILARDITKILE